MMKTTLSITTVFTLLFGLLAFVSPASANDGSLLRQASHLEDISYQMARELRHAGVHGSLRDDAEKLAREARRFRDALAGRSDRYYVQARYDEMAKYYERFERRYRRSQFGPEYRHVHRTYVSITSVFYGINGSYVSYVRGWDAPRREPDRIVIHRAPPIIYAPFGLQHDRRDDWNDYDRHDNDRHDYDRHDSDRNGRNERGGRNHYR
ncbi:MAG: hypothetical protein Q7V56_12460 [Gammaproteobacteria bacterium]|nr:hypothetical protein [Gammaproteobacteria bacterium]